MMRRSRFGGRDTSESVDVSSDPQRTCAVVSKSQAWVCHGAEPDCDQTAAPCSRGPGTWAGLRLGALRGAAPGCRAPGHAAAASSLGQLEGSGPGSRPTVTGARPAAAVCLHKLTGGRAAGFQVIGQIQQRHRASGTRNHQCARWGPPGRGCAAGA